MNKRAPLEAYGNISLTSGHKTPPPAKPKKPREETPKVIAKPTATKPVSSQQPIPSIDNSRPEKAAILIMENYL